MAIEFWGTSDEYGWCSNFYKAPIIVNGKTYATSEHFYQSQKYVGLPREEEIRLAPTPGKAAVMGRDRSYPIRPDWEKVKDQVMYRAVAMKFVQNPELRVKLLATGDDEIREASPIDDYWGVGPDGKGKNMLGVTLMKIRQTLQDIVKM